LMPSVGTPGPRGSSQGPRYPAWQGHPMAPGRDRREPSEAEHQYQGVDADTLSDGSINAQISSGSDQRPCTA
jgi:hypothetical protein